MRTLEHMDMLQRMGGNNQPMDAHPFVGMQQPPVPQRQSPISSGAMSGMQAARSSIAMDEEQRRRAMGQAMMHIFNNMYQGQPSFGVGALARSMNESVLPAVEAHNRQREMSEVMNLKLMQREDALRHQAEQEQMQQDRLNEQRRYHDARIGLARESAQHKSEGKGSGNVKDFIETNSGLIDLSGYPQIKTAAERNAISKDYRAFNATSKIVEEAYKDYKELKKLSAGSALDTTGSLVPGSRNIKDTYGRALPETKLGAQLNKERILRNKLGSNLQNIQVVLEKAAKGSAPGEQMMKRFHEQKVYPEIGMPMDEIGERLKFIQDEVNERKDLSKMSLSSGRQIDRLPEHIQEPTSSRLESESGDKVSLFRQKYPKYNKYSDDDVAQAIMRFESEGVEW